MDGEERKEGYGAGAAEDNRLFTTFAVKQADARPFLSFFLSHIQQQPRSRCACTHVLATRAAILGDFAPALGRPEAKVRVGGII